MDKARDLIMVIAKTLVDNPDEVSVNVRSRENTVLFELTVSKEDIGKIIGRQGRRFHPAYQGAREPHGRWHERSDMSLK